MDFYTERYGKARPMTKEELERHYEIIDNQNKEIENYMRKNANEIKQNYCKKNKWLFI